MADYNFELVKQYQKALNIMFHCGPDLKNAIAVPFVFILATSGFGQAPRPPTPAPSPTPPSGQGHVLSSPTIIMVRGLTLGAVAFVFGLIVGQPH